MKIRPSLTKTLTTILSLSIAPAELVDGQSISTATPLHTESWSDVFGIVGVSGHVNAVKFHGNDLYVVGDFEIAGNVVANGIAKWDGRSWTDVGGGVTLTDSKTGRIVSELFALEIANNSLYVGGSFGEIGGVKANNVARFDLRTVVERHVVLRAKATDTFTHPGRLGMVGWWIQC